MEGFGSPLFNLFISKEMAITMQDIDKNLPGGANMGGISQTIYFCTHEDVATFPTEPDLATAADMEAMGQLTGALVMKAGKKMNKIYVTDDTGEVEMESVGELDGKSFVMHLRFLNPGLQKKILGFINYAKNSNLVFIAPDNNGNLFLLGDATRAAVFAASPDGIGTGKETSARAGVSMEFTYKTKSLYHYTGTIPLTAAL